MKPLRLSFSLLLLFSGFGAYAQVEEDTVRTRRAAPVEAEELTSIGYFNHPTIVQSSPEAAALGQYGKTPVSLYTGTTEVSIPLYEINLDGKSIPITLSYHGSGIKLAQEASWVGLGWSLQAEGRITAEIRGGNDFGPYEGEENWPTGYYYGRNWPYFVDSLNNVVNVDGLRNAWENDKVRYEHDKGFYESYFKGMYDVEPDLFHYNVAGYSGSMSFDRIEAHEDWHNPEAYMLKNEHYLRAIYNVDNHYWILYDGDGYSYYFHTIEESDSYSKVGSLSTIERDVIFTGNRRTDISCWCLDSIVSPLGNSVQFEYIPVEIYTSVVMGEEICYLWRYDKGPNPWLPQTPNPCKFYSYSCSKVKSMLLNRIVFPGGEILFETSERDDIEPVNAGEKAKKLDNVVVKNYLGETVKQFDFEYEYRGGRTDASLSRLFLLSVKETLSEEKAYCFVYQAGNLPGKDSYAVDFWGYYNGVRRLNTDNTSNPSTPSFALSPSFCHKYGMDGGYIFFKGKDMHCNEEYMQYGVLREIIYPTGGKTRYTYEPHEFVNSFSCGDENVQLSGLSFDESDRSCVGEHFHLDVENLYSRPDLFYINWGYSWRPEDTPVKMTIGVALERLDEETGEYEEVKRFAYETQDDNSGKTIQTSPFSLLSLSGTYRLVLYRGEGLTCNLFASLHKYVKQTYDKGGGLRIKEIVNIDEAGKVVQKKLYRYEKGNESTGILINSPDPFHGITAWDGVAYAYSYLDAYYNYAPSGDCGGSSVGYSYVEDITETTSGNSWKTGYQYWNVSYDALLNGMFVPGYPVFLPPQNGQLRWTTDINEAGDTVRTTDYYYTTVKYGRQKGMKLYRPIFTETTEVVIQDFCKFYDLDVVTSALDSVVETYWDGDTEQLYTKTAYRYDPLTRLTAEADVRNRGGSLKRTEVKYSSTQSAGMKAEHIVNVPMEVIEHTNGTLSGAARQTYKDTLGLWLPVCTDRLRLDSPGGVLSAQHYELGYRCRYNKRGKIVELTTPDGLTTVYLWGYRGMYPVAEIRNAVYSSVQRLLKNRLQLMEDADTPDAYIEAVSGLAGTFPGAQVTTYTYKPLVGMTSKRDSNGLTVWYDYDAAGRLVSESVEEKDGSRKVVRQYEYNYGHQ